jgi:homopolymeric O-antigen transport system permease protein
MPPQAEAARGEVLLQPRRGWQPLDVREMWHYRDLLVFLVLRDIRIRYRQTVLGGLWAIVQPLLGMIVFTLLFHRRGGGVINVDPPYQLFAFTGLAGWTFFANAVSSASMSLIGNQPLISKVYFPRIFMPLGSVGAFAADLTINIVVVFALMAYFDWSVTPSVLSLPLFVVGTFLAASGIGIILAALNVWYRDVKYVAPFLLQMGLFVTPIIYPLEWIPDRYRVIVALNPMVGMVEGFRYALLGTPLPTAVIAVSAATSGLLFVLGLYMFRSMERVFADVI